MIQQSIFLYSCPLRCENQVFQIEAQDRVYMLYWLDALQKKRRLFSLRQSNLAQDFFMGKKKQLVANGLLGRDSTDGNDELCPAENNSDNSSKFSLLDLRKEIRNAVSTIRASASDTSLNRSSTALSEDWSLVDDMSTAPHTFTSESNNKQNTNRPNSFSGRSEDILGDTAPSHSEQTIILENYMRSHDLHNWNNNKPVTSQNKPMKPQVSSSANGKPSKFISALKSNFKMMKESVKERNQRSNPSSRHNSTGSQSCYKCMVLAEDLASKEEYIKSTEEELHANNEIIKLLQKELAVMTAEINTRKECEGKDEDAIQQILKQKDKHIIELEYSRTVLLEERSTLKQDNRLLENELKDLSDQISMFKTTIAVKDEMIVSLTNQNQELRSNQSLGMEDKSNLVRSFPIDPISLAAERKEQERLADACKAYEIQNQFLTKEILALNELRQHDETRQKFLNMNIAKLEAQYYQTRSKYLFLLNEKQVPVRDLKQKLFDFINRFARGGDENNSQDVVNQLLQEALEAEVTEAQEDVAKTFISSQNKEYDQYGFLKFDLQDSDVLLSRANILSRQSLEMEYQIRDADEETSKKIKWENFMVGQSIAKPLVRSPDLKLLIRLGIPHEYREKIWKGCIDFYVKSTRDKLGAKYYKELSERANNNKSNPAIKQIQLDLLRTLPDNRYFDKIDSPGISKLRRVLLCYSVHNPLIGYCQGINRIAAIALLFLREEDAFWCLVAIIEHLMPADYYTTTLAAAQADQRVLKDLVKEKCAALNTHLEEKDVDLSLFTFNWFLTVFIDGIRPELFLRIWDVFLYEGSKIMFRYALAFLKYAEDDILKQPNSLATNRYMRTLGESITDVKRIYQIAFHELNPFPMRAISNKRQYHLQQVKIELEELEKVRKDMRSAHAGDEECSQNKQGYFSEDDQE
ncbi:TBC1 domain family member 2B-like isoform X3 [Biomphalaria glabrata]|uniref:TBC1 domain family member 2B-like isoform X3 n=1 Tax=Biomphalaria glabrata TaxID=6526 RepID=A0A9W3ADV5_BIOGL|nr:TBC1 domain family member 2B-like isoform X3 [Biomphalaria glabrata]